MKPTHRSTRRIAATVLAATSSLSMAALIVGSPAEAKRAAKTCKFANLETNSAAHAASFTANGITATDDWETVSAVCNNENVEGKLTAKSTLTLRRTPQRSKTAPAKGIISGPIVLGYSFGATQTGGGWSLRGTAPYTCAADGTCTFSGKLTFKGKPAGTWSGSFVRPTADAEGVCNVTFEDILVSS